MESSRTPQKQAIARERLAVLQRLETWLDLPMLLLSIIWLMLFVVELVWGLTPGLEAVNITIWVLFILEFLLEFTLAPRKLPYVKQHWIETIALFLPALRVFRFVRIFRVLQATQATRGVQLLRVLARTNQSMEAFSDSFSRRGFGYVVSVTILVALSGAAVMYFLEQDVPGTTAFSSYGAALWWTAMLLTTMGSEGFPETPEGKILCFLLAIYGFVIFGYLTACLSTFFIGQDAGDDNAEIAGTKSIEALRSEIAALREELRVRFDGEEGGDRLEDV